MAGPITLSSRPHSALQRTQGYGSAELRTDLARFTFLPGHDDGEQLFGHDRRDGHPIHRRQGDAMTDPSTPPAP